MTSYRLEIQQSTSVSARTVSLSAPVHGNEAHVEGLQTRSLGSIPATQAYYWKHAWQDAETETLESLAKGNGRRFATGREAIAWLLSDEEDESDG